MASSSSNNVDKNEMIIILDCECSCEYKSSAVQLKEVSEINRDVKEDMVHGIIEDKALEGEHTHNATRLEHFVYNIVRTTSDHEEINE